jgi:hypothetical protein
MPRPKRSARPIHIRLTEKAWKNIEGKGEISKLVNEAVEKFSESNFIIDINQCPQYSGVHPKNPSLIGCKDEKGKLLWKPKPDCQACRYYKINHVIIESVENKERQCQKLTEDISKLKPMVEKLKEEAKGMNINDLKTQINYWKGKYEEMVRIARTISNEKEQLSKIKPQVEYRDRIVEKPQYIERTAEKIVEKTVYAPSVYCFYQDKFVVAQDCEACTEKCAMYSKIKTQST